MSLYRRILGPAFAELPPTLQALHDGTRATAWQGRADVGRGSSPAMRLLATLFQLPPAGPDQMLTLTFDLDGDREIWTRTFGDSRFRSVQFERDGQLHETVGPGRLAMCRLIMGVSADSSGLQLTMLGTRLLGVPLPRFLVPQIRAVESEQNGRFHFDVEARLPAFGRLVHYRGWLERVIGPASLTIATKEI
jgi:Domain of unknown function (DUF4166)